ncbi:MAG: ABC transporter ATP-binding protein [bacterium]|nr:ABC transporter ATP-binding protein [bacterium]
MVASTGEDERLGASSAKSPDRDIFLSMTEAVRLEFVDVAKRYDMRVIFKGISGAVQSGEILLLTGPNGSGKSTLVAILCGLLRPTRGHVRYMMDDVELSRSDWRRHLAVVAPSMSLYEELDAMENLRFFATVRGLADVEELCRECLDEVGLDPERKTPVRGFSTGMVQRLKIAQAMLHEPEVLFLDEPGSNLDPSGQDWLASWVKRVSRAGTTIVLATNDRQEMEWGDRRVALGD